MPRGHLGHDRHRGLWETEGVSEPYHPGGELEAVHHCPSLVGGETSWALGLGRFATGLVWANHAAFARDHFLRRHSGPLKSRERPAVASGPGCSQGRAGIRACKCPGAHSQRFKNFC